MATESLVALALMALGMLLISIYANKHREKGKPLEKLYKRPKPMR